MGNFDRIAGHAAEDDILADRERTQAGGKLVAAHTHLGELGKELEAAADGADEAIGARR
jgi:hypothetical protein